MPYPRSVNEKTYWKAVEDSDARFDGAFVYAVRSTGVYCRPSCPSRRPRREQVVFFAAPAEAERAGFRACRRCRPRDGGAGRSSYLPQITAYIDSHLEEPCTLAALSDHVGVSPYHLQRTFKRVMGITPRQYAEARRVGRLKASLRKGRNVAEALYEAGYGSSSRLYERSDARLGMTPATYRRGGEAMHINYTIVDCGLGRLLVGATERGVCGVSLGDSDGTLEAFLRSEYPNAEISRDENGRLSRWVSGIVKHLSGRQPRIEVPVDVEATAFQWRVWEALKAIPYGVTRTYSQVARSLGRPTATRAVARACATNPVAVVIPCHRVIREDGGLGGYRWGLDRKRAMIDQERAGAQ